MSPFLFVFLQAQYIALILLTAPSISRLWNALDSKGHCDTHLDREHDVPAYRTKLSPGILGDIRRSQLVHQVRECQRSVCGKLCLTAQTKQQKFEASCTYWDFAADAPDAKAACKNSLQSFLHGIQARDNLKIYAV